MGCNIHVLRASNYEKISTHDTIPADKWLEEDITIHPFNDKVDNQRSFDIIFRREIRLSPGVETLMLISCPGNCDLFFVVNFVFGIFVIKKKRLEII